MDDYELWNTHVFREAIVTIKIFFQEQ